jgi:hypothetical protein
MSIIALFELASLVGVARGDARESDPKGTSRRIGCRWR